jgi:hypothetical protein
MIEQDIVLLWVKMNGAGTAQLVGAYSSVELAEERIARCRQVPGFSEDHVDFVVSRAGIDHNERRTELVDG